MRTARPTTSTRPDGIAFSPLDHALYVCNPSLGLVRVEAGGRHAIFAVGAGGQTNPRSLNYVDNREKQRNDDAADDDREKNYQGRLQQ